jgi:hypothetical protein
MPAAQDREFNGDASSMGASLATMGLDGGSDLLVGGCGLAGFLVLLVANLGLIVFDRWFGGKAITRGSEQAGELATQNMSISEARV